MSTSIGTAWIQIKPSMKGVSDEIRKSFNGAESSVTSDFNNKFKSGFVSTAKSSFQEAFSEFGKRSDAAWEGFKGSAKVALAGVTAGLVGATTYAIKQFADYEQLVGGVDTLFKNSSQTVQDYAKQSYKSAQLSANQYMETITGFSASLLQGLGGDTAKAAKIGNMAVIDMADNANKMGTSMESIQYAYQGFAKQNFTMLDNLKLGYGGTQSEMARLINKSGVMGKTFKATAENVNSIPFNKVIEAIHKIQGELGITGTSALEASTTISGSFNTAKAAFNDMIVSLSNPSADFSSELNKFLDSSKTFLNNLRPVVKNIASTVFGEIKKQSPELAKFLEQVYQTVLRIIDFVKNNQELVLNIVKVVVGFKALQIATGGARAAFDTLKPYGKILQGTFQLAVGGVQSLIGKFSALGNAKGGLDQVAGGIDKMSDASKRAPKTFTFGDSIASFFKNIGKTLSGAVEAVMAPLKALLSGIGEAIAGFFKAFASPQLLLGILVFTAAAGAVALAILMIGSAIGAISPALGDFLNMVIIPLGTFLMGVFVVALAAVTIAIIKLTNEAVIPLIGAIAGGLTSVFVAIGGVIGIAGTAISRVIDSISGGIAKVIDSIANLLRSVGGQDWYGTGYGITRNFSAGLIDGLIDLLQDSLNKIINNLINIPGIGDALKAVGVKANAVNLSGFKLGRRAMGGPVFGPGSGTSDSIPMAISNGEYVIKAATAQKVGYANLEALNRTGEMDSGSFSMGDIIINGYDKDKKELAEEISKIIARKRKRVLS